MKHVFHTQIHLLKSSLQCCVRSKQADERSCHNALPGSNHLTLDDRHVHVYEGGCIVIVSCFYSNKYTEQCIVFIFVVYSVIAS